MVKVGGKKWQTFACVHPLVTFPGDLPFSIFGAADRLCSMAVKLCKCGQLDKELAESFEGCSAFSLSDHAMR